MAKLYSCTECGKLDESCTKFERCCDDFYDKIETENNFRYE